MANEGKPNPMVCMGICQYLGEYNADIDTLAEHCGCSVGSVRKSLTFLRSRSIHVQSQRDPTDGRHYWYMDTKLEPGEVWAHMSYLFLPEDLACIVVDQTQGQGQTP